MCDRTETAKKADSTDNRQTLIADDVHYHAEKLGFGGHGAHEGWIKAEDGGTTVKTVNQRS